MNSQVSGQCYHTINGNTLICHSHCTSKQRSTLSKWLRKAHLHFSYGIPLIYMYNAQRYNNCHCQFISLHLPIRSWHLKTGQLQKLEHSVIFICGGVVSPNNNTTTNNNSLLCSNSQTETCLYKYVSSTITNCLYLSRHFILLFTESCQFNL